MKCMKCDFCSNLLYSNFYVIINILRPKVLGVVLLLKNERETYLIIFVLFLYRIETANSFLHLLIATMHIMIKFAIFCFVIKRTSAKFPIYLYKFAFKKLHRTLWTSPVKIPSIMQTNVTDANRRYNMFTHKSRLSSTGLETDECTVFLSEFPVCL